MGGTELNCTKILLISDTYKAEVIGLAGQEETAGKLFKIYQSREYDVSSIGGLRLYVSSVLQNHEVRIIPQSAEFSESQYYDLEIDGVLYGVNPTNLTLKCYLTGDFYHLPNSTRQKVNNLNEYRMILEFLSRNKVLIQLYHELDRRGIQKLHISISTHSKSADGIFVDCRTWSGSLDDFRVFRNFADGRWSLVCIFRHEGEIYYSGYEPYTIEDMTREMTQLQAHIDRYTELEKLIDGLNSDDIR